MAQEPLGVPSTLDIPTRVEQLEARVELLEQLLAARALVCGSVARRLATVVA